MFGNDFVKIFVRLIRETEAAVLVDNRSGLDDIWVPKSLLEYWDDDTLERGDDVELSVATWFAEQEGLV